MVKARGLMRGGGWGGWLFLLALSGCRIFEVPDQSCEADSEWVGPCPVDAGNGDGGGTGTDGGGTGTDGGGTGTDGGGTGTDGGPTGTDGGSTGPDAGTQSDAGTQPQTDAGTQQPFDAGTQQPVDAGTQQPFDAGTQQPFDAGTQQPFDAGTQPQADSGIPGPFDAGTDELDAGTDTTGRLDGGPRTVFDDAGVIIADELPIGDCSGGLCLRHKYTLSPASDGFNGLWIFDPYDVYLAHTESAQVVQFNESFTPTTAPVGSSPYQLHGTTPDNLWAINPPEDEPTGRTPVSRFDGQSWAAVPAPNTGPSIRPPALFTGPGATWAAGSHGGALRWDGSTWHAEHPSGTARGSMQAFWSNTSEPLFAVGSVRGIGLPAELGAYWQRQTNGTWAGPFPLSTPGELVPALRAISGPGPDHLYAVGGKTVLRWTGTTWVPEALPSTLPEGCQLSDAQDVWVKWDGTDVWVTFDTACVLRKKDGIWAAQLLPVLPTFQARQVEGFHEADGKTVDLWFTGYQPEGLTPGAAAYHFTLNGP
ncbi:MAG TPA: hypothetical protein VF815_05410 [Myxococcaceae bacterium]|jgi:hypothetical protein